MSWKRWVVGGSIGATGILCAGLAAAIGYAAVTADALLAFPDTPYPSIEASTDAEVIARGKYLVHGPAHCASCHSTDDRAHPEKVRTAPLDGGLAFAMGPIGTRYGANLTPDPETGIGRWTDAEIARTIRTGVLPSGELSFFMTLSTGQLADEDLVAVISYLRSLEPVRNDVPEGSWTLFGEVLLVYAMKPLSPRLGAAPAWAAPAEEPSLARGEYVTGVAACLTCHTESDPATFEFIGPKGGGGTVEPSHGEDSHMEYAPPNLTSHPTGITGRLGEEAFVARLRGGRAHASSIMPWENYAATTDADLRSIYRYLRTLPPVDRDTGPPYREVGWTPGG